MSEIRIKIIGHEDVALLRIKPSAQPSNPKGSTLEVIVNSEIITQVEIPAIIGHEDVQFIRIKLVPEKPKKK